jgi:hypothetical protein
MASIAPWDFRPELHASRLRVVAEALLEVLYDVELEMSGDLDDGYTRGTTTFGRQRNALIRLCQSGRYPWLKLTNAAMDLTFEIGGVPCRYFVDDPASPKKPGYFRRNDCDKLFPETPGTPEVFRFVIVKPQTADDEADVCFVGYDASFEEAFRWHYSQSTPTLASVDVSLPAPVDLPAPRAMVRKREDEAGDKAIGEHNAPQD